MNDLEKYMEEEQNRRGYADSYVSAMKRRVNLQMIGGFIRDGSSRSFVNNDSFRQRESEAFAKLDKLLKEKCGEKEADEIMECVNVYIGVEQEVHFSLGMKAGAILQCKLTDNFETDV